MKPLSTRITPREKEVLNLIAYEHSSKEIADKLYVSYETVNSHRKNIMDKLGVKNTAGLVRVAFERGLMRVGQVAMIVMLFLASFGANAQVSNGNVYNWQVRTTEYQFGGDDNTYDSQNGDNYPVFLVRADIDDNGQADVLMNLGANENHMEDVCIKWTADIPTSKAQNEYIEIHTNESETKFDFDVVNFDRNPLIIINRCFPSSADFHYHGARKLHNAKYLNSNEWNPREQSINGNNSTVTYETIWRYRNGNNFAQALDFGSFSSGTRNHINSNRVKPDGANSAMGYTNNIGSSDSGTGFFDTSPDVFYTFSISETQAKRITISTDHDETDFDTEVFLLLVYSNGSYVNIASDDDGGDGFSSTLIADLAPLPDDGSKYVIAVEGHATRQGNFKLSINLSNATVNAGSIAQVGESLCLNAPFPTISSTGLAGAGTAINYNLGTPTYVWERNINGTLWEEVGSSESLPTNTSEKMGDQQNVVFRRRATLSGNVANSNEVTFTFQSSTNNPGVIKYQDNEMQNFVREGYVLPANITNVTSAILDPSPLSGADTYRWEKKEGVSEYDIIDGATSELLTSSQLGPVNKTTLIRRVSINGCQSDSASNVLTIEAIKADGVIEGTITPPLSPTTGIADVSVCAVSESSLYGVTSECDTTGNDGIYRFSNLYYGKEDVTYKITPILEEHVIRVSNNVTADSTKDITIGTSAGSSKLGQNFVDLTSYTLSGNISHLYNGVKYGKGGVEIYLDNKNDANDVPQMKGTTDKDGNYSIPIGSPGTWTITPKLEDLTIPAAHVFDMPSRDIEVLDNVTDVDFRDLTEKRLTAFIGAGCDQYLGSLILKLMEDPNEGPLSITLTTDSDGRIDKMIPARDYKIVQIVDASISTVNLIDDFDSFVGDIKTQYGTFVGHQSLMTFGDDDINVVYRAPLSMDVTGVPASGMGCDVNPLYDFPKLDQAEFYPEFKIRVFEGLIRGSNECLLDTGFVDVTDGIGDRGSGRVGIRDGEAAFVLRGGTPKIEAPYTKRLDLNAQSLNPLATGVDTTITAIVVGERPRTKKLNTVTPELPLLVLHDPPGDLSYAFLESGQTQETAIRFYSKKATVRDSWDNIKIGSESSISVGSFVSVSTNITSYGQLGQQFESNRSDVSINETIIGVSTTDRYQTDSNPNSDVIGDEGDVFVGGAYNMITALTDTINFSNTCELELGVSLFISPDSFATTYIKTARAIANDIKSFNETIEVMENNGENSSFLKAQVDVWQQMLDNNQKKKDRAKITDANFVENLTFSGSTETSSSTTTTETQVNTIEFLMELDTSILGEYKIEVAGNGVNGGFMTKFKTETGDTDINTSRSSFTTGYFLHDDDPDDEFSVDVYTDPDYRTPLFKVRDESVTSCPVEAGTQSLTQFTVETTTPGSLSGINPAEEGEYTIRISNTGSQTTTFTISNDDAYNANAAMVSIGGNAPGIDGSVDIIAGQSADVVVRVSKAGSSQVFSYPDLHINIEPACSGAGDKNALKVIKLSAYFTSLCSNITLFAPTDGTLVSSQLNNPTLEIQMKDYEVSKIGSVVLEYRPKGQGSWTPSNSVFLSQGQMSTIGASPTTVANWNVGEAVGDGEYELRLKVVCATGINYSSLRTINVNREAPQPIGIPSPIDDVYDLSANDEISVFYNEEIACNNGSAVIVNLVTNDTIGTVGDMLVCFSNKLTIVPQTALPPASVFRVIVSGVTDIYGNIADTYRWVFTTPGYNFEEAACLPDLEISNNNENQDAISVTAYRALAISSNGVIPDFGVTTYTAQEEVSLGSGFEVTEGGILEANIEDCDDSDN